MQAHHPTLDTPHTKANHRPHLVEHDAAVVHTMPCTQPTEPQFHQTTAKRAQAVWSEGARPQQTVIWAPLAAGIP